MHIMNYQQPSSIIIHPLPSSLPLGILGYHCHQEMPLIIFFILGHPRIDGSSIRIRIDFFFKHKMI